MNETSFCLKDKRIILEPINLPVFISDSLLEWQIVPEKPSMLTVYSNYQI